MNIQLRSSMTEKKETFFEKRVLIKIVLFFSVAQIMYLIIGVAYNHINATNKSLAEMFLQWDAGWYNIIATRGYDTMEEVLNADGAVQRAWVFMPAYPMTVKNLNKILPFLSVPLCGMVVSNVCTFITAIYAISYSKLTKRAIDENVLLCLLYLGPYSFYFNSMYTEAMFVMFIVMHFYYCKKEKYVMAGICAGVASATRVVGVLLVFVMIYNMFLKTNGENICIKLKNLFISIFVEPVKMLSILLCPAGLFAYMLYLNYLLGDALAFMHGQIGWARKDRSIFESLYCALSGQEGQENLYLGICVILIFSLVVYLLINKEWDECLYSFITLYIPLRSAVGCAPRYAIGVFFPLFATAQILSGKKISKLILGVSVLYEVVLVYWWFDTKWLLI